MMIAGRRFPTAASAVAATAAYRARNVTSSTVTTRITSLNGASCVRTHMNHGGGGHHHHGETPPIIPSGPRSPAIPLGLDATKAGQNILRLLESSHGSHSHSMMMMFADANAPSWHRLAKRFVLDVDTWTAQSPLGGEVADDERQEGFYRPTTMAAAATLESLQFSDDRTALCRLRGADGIHRYLSLLRLDASPLDMSSMAGAPLANDGWVIVREVVVPRNIGGNDADGRQKVQAMTALLQCLQDYMDVEHGGGSEDLSKAQILFHPDASLLTVGTGGPEDASPDKLWSAPTGQYLEISLPTYLEGVATQTPHNHTEARSQDVVRQVDVDASGLAASAIVRVANGARTLVFEDHLLLGRSHGSPWTILSKTFSPQSWPHQHVTTTNSSSKIHPVQRQSTRRTFHSSSTSLSSLQSYLSNQIESGTLHPDRAQQGVAKRLSRLEEALAGYDNSIFFEQERQLEEDKKKKNDKKITYAEDDTKAETADSVSTSCDPSNEAAPTRPRLQIPRGLYIYGSVGTGKTMLMDAFYNTVDIIPPERKRRFHFHNFLSIVHDRVHQLKQKDLETKGRNFAIDTSQANNPIYRVGMQLSSEMSLLCLDEFQVTDIADAVILSQLFSVLFQHGTVVVATSNRPPEDLYEGGLNRGYFLPFIDLIKRHSIVCPIRSDQDYRRLLSSFSSLSSFFVSDLDDDDQMDNLITKLGQELSSDFAEPEETSMELAVGHQRRMIVDQTYRIYRGACETLSIACFSFGELCDKDRGAMDYRAIANEFDVVVLRDVPVMDTEGHNRARRFITLIDELYEGKCALLCATTSLETIETPMDLFATPRVGIDSSESVDESVADDEGSEIEWVDVAQQGGTPVGALASVRELAFAFERASSRIYEMTSRAWWDRVLGLPKHTTPTS